MANSSAEIYVLHPSIDRMPDYARALFVSVDRGPPQRMKERVPQFVVEMYACAKRLKSVVDSLIQWLL